MGYRLVLLNGPTPGASVDLDQASGSVSIGRDPGRDLPIDDHQVSRLHARVWHDGREWQIEDCGSRNGTLVNSQRVERSVLQPGDLIRIGERLLVFLLDTKRAGLMTPRPSVFARTTCAVRMPTPADQRSLLAQLRSIQASRPVRNLSLLCRLTTVLARESKQEALVAEVTDTLTQALGAVAVHVYLTGSDGRLQRCRGRMPVDTPADRGHADGSRLEGDGHLLASLAVDHDEAILIDTRQPPSPEDVEQQVAEGTAMGVPIPGRGRPRGAIACFAAAAGGGSDSASAIPFDGVPAGAIEAGARDDQVAVQQSFDQGDLELAMAVSYHFGTVLENLEHRHQLEQANEQLQRRVARENRLLGSSPAIKALLDQVGRVAVTDSTVLVTGESGTGKELVADTIHRLSRRGSGPFVAVNCAAFNESLLESELFGHEAGAFTGADQRRLGQFERAHLGTIFLDEVGEMSAACQAKLLRLLEGHPFERLGGSTPVRVDLRIVAATHRDLRELVARGRFREDLYYRLRVIELSVPPLRLRGADSMTLAVAFLERFHEQVGRGPRRFSTRAAEAIRVYHWPGNVRELKNAVERAVVLGQCDEILPEDLGLPQEVRGVPPAGPLISLRQAELQHITAVLEAVGGNKTKACHILGIGRGTLYKKLAAGR